MAEMYKSYARMRAQVTTTEVPGGGKSVSILFPEALRKVGHVILANNPQLRGGTDIICEVAGKADDVAELLASEGVTPLQADEAHGFIAQWTGQGGH